MNTPGSIFGSFSLTAPVWLLVAVPFVLLLVWELGNWRKSGTIAITDLEYLRSQLCIIGQRRRWLRALIWCGIAIAIGLLLGGPNVRSEQPLFEGSRQVSYQKFLLMLDLSRSMSVPLGQEKNVTLPGQGVVRAEPEGEQIPRYHAARAALMDFVERFNEAQIGLILFSAEPILARWPTVETEGLFWEVLEEDIGRGVISQLQLFSSLTNINKALILARETFAKQGAREGAAILITDAEDDIESIGLAARNLRNDGIRLYIIGAGIAEQTTERLEQNFSQDPGFRIFHVDSDEEMQEAYRLVAEVEESLPYELEQKEYTNDLRWLLSLFLVMTTGLLFWLSESSFHQSQTANYPMRSINGRRRGRWLS